MANTAITLTNEQGVLVPSKPSVAVKSGDTVSFATSDGSTAYLFFSQGAAAILSPAPLNPVKVWSQAAEFAFTSSSPGTYSVYFETSTEVTLPPFPVVPSNLLMLEVDSSNIGFGVLHDRTRGS